MNHKKEKYAVRRVGVFITATLFLVAAFCNTAAINAQSSANLADGFRDDVIKTENFALDAPMEVKDPAQEESEQFLANLKAELRATQKELYDVRSNVVDTEKKMETIHSEISTLSGQLANLDELIFNTENMIKNVMVQITEKENRIRLLMSDLKVKEIEMANQKMMLSEYLKALYEHESAVSDTLSDNDRINIAKLLLSDETAGEQLMQIKYLNILEQSGHELFEQLEETSKEFEEEKTYLEDQKVKLDDLKSQLEIERRQLVIQKEAKENLLLQTRGEEGVYAQMLNESIQQQLQIQEDIRILREALVFIQEKMVELGDKFDPNDYRHLFTGEKISVYEFINATKNVQFVELDWPVSPDRGISAYFRDPSYAAFFGVRHNAIDIRVPQETVIRAPADGVVYKAKDNGYGYSYLILAHEGGYMTVYGHIPQFLVEPGEKVYRGQSVALSGGTPGTKGAGLMTTGAHLHFEVMKDGTYVDPIFYLPLDGLSFELPEKYTALVSPEPPKVRREALPEASPADTVAEQTDALAEPPDVLAGAAGY